MVQFSESRIPEELLSHLAAWCPPDLVQLEDCLLVGLHSGCFDQTHKTGRQVEKVKLRVHVSVIDNIRILGEVAGNEDFGRCS